MSGQPSSNQGTGNTAALYREISRPRITPQTYVKTGASVVKNYSTYETNVVKEGGELGIGRWGEGSLLTIRFCTKVMLS